MTSDLKARLDAMVREKMGGVSRSHPTTPFKLAGALGHVALDLLQERDALKDRLDAAEARVKALTAERDELVKAKLWRDHWPSGDLLELAREEHKTNEALKAHWAASYRSRQDSEKGRAIAEAHTKAFMRLLDALFVAVHEERETFDRTALEGESLKLETKALTKEDRDAE